MSTESSSVGTPSTVTRQQAGAGSPTGGSGDELPVAWGNSDTADPRDRPPTAVVSGVKLTATMRTAREIVTSLQPLPRRPGTPGPKAVGQRTALRPAPPRNDELYGYGFLSNRPSGDAPSPGRAVYGSGVFGGLDNFGGRTKEWSPGGVPPHPMKAGGPHPRGAPTPIATCGNMANF